MVSDKRFWEGVGLLPDGKRRIAFGQHGVTSFTPKYNKNTHYAYQVLSASARRNILQPRIKYVKYGNIGGVDRLIKGGGGLLFFP